MEEILNSSVLDEMFEDRSEKLSRYLIKDNAEYVEKEKEMSDKLKELLKYVPGEHYKALENEIEEFLFDHVMYMSEFWCEKYYKIGFADGLNVKKELQEELEGLKDEQEIR